MRELPPIGPQERIGGLWCWLLVIETSRFDTDQRKSGRAFQPGMAW
jgi:hypothetical protein